MSFIIPQNRQYLRYGQNVFSSDFVAVLTFPGPIRIIEGKVRVSSLSYRYV